MVVSNQTERVPAHEFRQWSERALLEHIAVRQEEQTMALADLQAAVASLEQAEAAEQAEVTALLGEAKALHDQVAQLQASGGTVSTADLDAVTASIAKVVSSAQAAVTAAKSADPANAPAPAPGPAPGPPSPAPAPGPVPEPTPAPAPAPPAPAPVPAPAASDRSVYTFDGDPATVDAATWPTAPLHTAETPPRQLYYFAGDTQPGEVAGDGVAGMWHHYTGEVVAAPGTAEAQQAAVESDAGADESSPGGEA